MSYAGLNQTFAERLEEIRKAALAQFGVNPFSITSGYRSPEQQAQIIYDNWHKFDLDQNAKAAWMQDVAELGPKAAGDKWEPIFTKARRTVANGRGDPFRNWIGLPDRSYHQGAGLGIGGLAIDIEYANDQISEWMRQNAANYGLNYPLGNEPWHLELAGVRDGRMPDTRGTWQDPNAGQNQSNFDPNKPLNMIPALGLINMPNQGISNKSAPQNTQDGTKKMSIIDYLKDPQAMKERIMRRDPASGLTLPQKFGAGLDALILRGYGIGDTIREQGAQQVAYDTKQNSKNQTITMLKAAAQSDPIAAKVLMALESGAIDATQAASLWLGKLFETPKDDRTSQMKNYEYWIKKGKSPEEAEALVKSGGITVGGQEKEYDKAMGAYFAQKNIDMSNSASQAQAILQTIQIQKNLAQDPSFKSGAGQQLFDTASQFLERLGIGEADVASNTAFQAYARKSVLDMLGGSLGTGVSNADVSFLNSTIASLDNSGASIALLLDLQEKVAKRTLQIAALSRQWKSDNETNFLDDRWDTYLEKWSEENPLFPDADDYL